MNWLLCRKVIRAGCSSAPVVFLSLVACYSSSVPDLKERTRVLQNDAMEEGSRKLMGQRGTDCGRVHIRQSPENANDCGLRAFKSGNPFRVRYDLQGIDSAVAEGVLRASDGKLYKTMFDGDPMGGGGISPTRQRFTTVLCLEPPEVRVNEDGHLDCFPDPRRKAVIPYKY